MTMNNTPSSNRIHIGLFGNANVGKSSIINAITNQEHAIVSSMPGTTTDPVRKTMELLPLGPVVFIDTAGIDDSSSLGKKRLTKTYEVLDKIDIALLVIDENEIIDTNLVEEFTSRKIPYLVVSNKSDLRNSDTKNKDIIYVSAKTTSGIQELKEAIATIKLDTSQQYPLISDLILPKQIIILVVPIDSAAPKGRIILPQQQTIREILDSDSMSLVCKESELEDVLKMLPTPPSLVITDSQVFESVSKVVPKSIPLTSFSILFARYKGSLKQYVEGLKALKTIKDNDKILIVEGCTHHRQCDDIGTVKLPKWIQKYTKKKLQFDFVSGMEFPQDVTSYSLVVHCGGCMLTSRIIQNRQSRCLIQGVSITNYGTLIAHMNGILERSLEPIKF